MARPDLVGEGVRAGHVGAAGGDPTRAVQVHARTAAAVPHEGGAVVEGLDPAGPHQYHIALAHLDALRLRRPSQQPRIRGLVCLHALDAEVGGGVEEDAAAYHGWYLVHPPLGEPGLAVLSLASD